MTRTDRQAGTTRWRLGGVAVLAALAVAVVDAAQPLPARSGPPNVVIIFADDLGYGDLGVYGHPTIRTPHLDRMAAEGQRWTSFYSQAPVCSPSRAALLTGRIHLRSGMFGRRQGVFFPDSHHGLPDDEITLAEALKELGYATGIVGKWHLGHQPEYRPRRHGFDSWFGIPYSNDMDWQVAPGREVRRAAMFSPSIDYWHVPLMRNDVELERPVDQTTITRRYAEEAVRFIREQRGGPFFLYMPHTMPHVPLFRSEAFAGRSAAGRYGDVIEEIDWSVGRILDTLREEGLAESTLVVFSSDNGPWLSYRQHGGSAGPLRQGKGTTWEGGMRVPGIFWWPRTIEPGVIRQMGATTDLFATIVPLAGGRLPNDRPLDGVDLSPALFGTGSSPRDWMAYYRMGELYAYRLGPHKVHLVTEGRYGIGAERTEHDPPLLYHLGHDPGERYDLAAERPDVVADLLTAVESHRRRMTVAEPLFDARGEQ
jgi:arylsulfatase A-like enzyme